MSKMVVLTDTRPLDSSNDPAVGACVIFSGSNRGNVKLPAAAKDNGFAGVCLEKKDTNNYIPIQTMGIAECISDGSAVMNPGDYVVIADTTGKVKSLSNAYNGTATNVTGFIGICAARAQIAATSGLTVDVLLQPFTAPTTA